MHASLAITTEGLPLGLTAANIWTRKKFKGSKSLPRRVNPTQIPIEKKESYRWIQNLRESNQLIGEASRCVHPGDRESDVYEFYCESARPRLGGYLARTHGGPHGNTVIWRGLSRLTDIELGFELSKVVGN